MEVIKEAKKRRTVVESFEVFLREPLSIIKTGLIQIVSITADNFFNQDSSITVNFSKNKTQLTVFNNIKLYNLLSMATARNAQRLERAAIVQKKIPFLQLSMGMRKS